MFPFIISKIHLVEHQGKSKIGRKSIHCFVQWREKELSDKNKENEELKFSANFQHSTIEKRRKIMVIYAVMFIFHRIIYEIQRKIVFAKRITNHF